LVISVLDAVEKCAASKGETHNKNKKKASIDDKSQKDPVRFTACQFVCYFLLIGYHPFTQISDTSYNSLEIKYKGSTAILIALLLEKIISGASPSKIADLYRWSRF